MRFSLKILLTSILTALIFTNTSALAAQPSVGQAQSTQVWDEFVGAPLQHLLENLPSTNDVNLRNDRIALQEFYAARDYRSFWIENGKLSAKARRVVFFLSRSATYGLDPEAYKSDLLSFGFGEPASGSQTALAEIQMAEAVLLYARQAHSGRIAPRQASRNLDINPEMPDPSAILADLAAAEDIKAQLISYNPPGPEFAALQEELARLKEVAATGGWVTIGAGNAIKPGMRDDRVITLKQRFGIPMPPPIIADPEQVRLYDGEVVDAVKMFQLEHGLADDGVIGPATLNQLNMSVIDRIYQVLANMERRRWMPREMADFYVQVDVPGFKVRIMKNGEPIHETRVVVGKPNYQTAIFSDTMEMIVVNPYWNVPASIVAEEMLPRLREDPTYYSQRNFELRSGWDSREGALDPTKINWSEVTPGNIPYHWRQRPGRGNALGAVKFLFPNRHSIYLHDTPSKSLFERTTRAFSHGCIRVYKPLEFADALLTNEPNLNADRIRREIGGENKTFVLENKIPIHITYITTWVENGRVIYRDDIYGHDRRVAAALGWR
ncbi:MAG: L,D-transpeptidase family protein [Fimbriimonadaceae bacterium]|nr:L,D-transpeptidase family protein [Alphaproteobacteria bacterium]